MNNNDKEWDDGLSQMITERLGERKRKLDKIKNWEKPAKHVNMWAIASLGVAVCVCAFFFLIPKSGETTPILMDEGDIRAPQAQMTNIDSAIIASDSIIHCLEQMEQTDEVKYEIEAERLKQNNLLNKKKN